MFAWANLTHFEGGAIQPSKLGHKVIYIPHDYSTLLIKVSTSNTCHIYFHLETFECVLILDYIMNLVK